MSDFTRQITTAYSRRCEHGLPRTTLPPCFVRYTVGQV